MRCIILLQFLLWSPNIFAQNNKNQKANITTNIYCSHCQECGTCGTILQKNLLKIKGVKSVQIVPAKNVIQVVYNENKTSLNTIKNTISITGYDADDVKADSESYAKLESCCKKK